MKTILTLLRSLWSRWLIAYNTAAERDDYENERQDFNRGGSDEEPARTDS